MATSTALNPTVTGLKNRGNDSPTQTPGTSSPSGDSTPGFAPNAPPSVVPSSELTLQSILYESGAGDGVNPATVDDWPLPDDIDFERPVSELLREGTQRAHVTAENSLGAVALTNGQLELKEYVRWLGLLWRVYDALETGLNCYAANPVLQPTYNPKLLARAPELAADIIYLLDRLPASERGTVSTAPKPSPTSKATHLPPFPLPPFLEEVFTTTPAPLAVYLDRLRELGASQQTAPRLLAHAYVRYLGDLSGGQIIGNRLRKAYGLEGLDGRRFYYFDLDQDTSAAEAGEETVGERKKKLHAVKAWYRDGMNQGAGDDAKLKASLVREANLAFLLNTHLFSLINPPAPKPKQRELRYYEKLELKRAAERAAQPPKTLADHLITLAYVSGAVIFGMLLFHVVWPFIRPTVIKHGMPVWEAYGAPLFFGKFVPFWNETFIPWWDKHAYPILSRQLAYSRRAMI